MNILETNIFYYSMTCAQNIVHTLDELCAFAEYDRPLAFPHPNVIDFVKN